MTKVSAQTENNIAAKSEVLSKLIADWIRRDIQDMRPHGDSGVVSLSPLKRLQRRLESTTSLESDREAQFFAFFLSVFLQDVFFNLTGDVPYSDGAEQTKQQLYGRLMDNLFELAETLDTADPKQKVSVCGKLVGTYLNGVRAINAALTQEQI